jgi:hypothetical protein
MAGASSAAVSWPSGLSLNPALVAAVDTQIAWVLTVVATRVEGL